MRYNRLLPLVMVWLFPLGLSATAAAQGRVESDVVYGMYSGTALLLDVHHPAPFDLLRMDPSTGTAAVALLLGARVTESTPKTSVEYRTAWAASPINSVSPDTAPFLLIHGDADRTVPFHQSEMMEGALRKAGVPVKLVTIAGGDHGPTFPGATNPPDDKAEMVKWFDLHLRKLSGSQ